jgi:hypothetical protein
MKNISPRQREILKLIDEKKDLIMEVRKNGIKMFHLGTVKLPEALSLPNYNNAVLMLEESGIIEDGKGAF